MALFLAPIINDQQENANGAPLSGGTIEVYLAGTSTPATTYFAQAGGVGNQNAWPISLNTLGVNSQGPVWLTGGASYKFIIKNSAGVLQRTIDNVSGINDTAVTTDQWVVYQAAPTYVSATSFTVAGDQTQLFHINRRLKTTNTGGTIYSTITNSVYGAPNTTVTVRNDSGVLDSGLSQVSYGIISILNSSVTGLLLNVQNFTASGTYTPTPGTTKILVVGQGSGGAGGGCTATAGGQVSVGAGGGSGAYGCTFLTSGFTPTTAVVIGTGGVPVGGAAGGSGTVTTFGAFITLTGGVGGNTGAAGAVSSAVNAAGGTASGGNVFNVSGQSSNFAISSFAQQYVQGSSGAPSMYGGGGIGVIGSATGPSTGNGGNALGRGSGGGGAAGAAGGSASQGGSGAGGILLVYEYA